MPNIIGRYRSIAVSGQACSGKSTICKLLGEKTGWTHVDVGSEFRKLAVNCHLEIEQFGSIPETSLREVDQEIAQRIAKEFNKIWDGRLVCYLSQPVDSVFKVYCTAPMEVRTKRLSQRERISIADASGKIKKRDI
jgi:cytidylate kinase